MEPAPTRQAAIFPRQRSGFFVLTIFVIEVAELLHHQEM